MTGRGLRSGGRAALLSRILSGVLVSAALAAGSGAPAADIDYSALYAKGATFADFLEAARRYREEWRANYASARPGADADARVRALEAHWRLLVVTEDWCADSLNTVPYLVKLAEAAPEKLSLRIVRTDAGRELMEAHRTPDGRTATPTIVIVDDAGVVRGVWVERPAALLSWAAEQTGLTIQELHDGRAKWYAEDAGRHAIADVLDLLEGAGREK